MQVKEIALPDGQWVKAHTRPSVKQMGALESISRQAEGNQLDALIKVVLVLVTEWHVKGEGDDVLPLSREGIEEAPYDVLTAISDALSPYMGAVDESTLPDRISALVDDLEDDDPIKARVIEFATDLGNG